MTDDHAPFVDGGERLAMSDTPDRLPADCPACAPSGVTDHEVLSPGGGSLTVRCSECGHVHKVQPERERVATVDVIVSQGGEAVPTTVELPADQRLAVGEEFVLESDEVLSTVRVTALELDGQRRRERATAEAVETVWTRAVDNVGVDVTIHPGDGPRSESVSARYYLPGEYELEVGATVELEDDDLEIDAIVVRDDATGYDRDRYDHAGDVVLAKDATRVYAYDDRHSPRSGW